MSQPQSPYNTTTHTQPETQNTADCSNCKHGQIIPNNDLLRCRRYPPASTATNPIQAIFPLVNGTDYCSEWAAKGSSTMGVTDGSDAKPGEVGEFLSNAVQPGSGIPVTTAVTLNVTTLNLPPGDWDLQGQVGTLAASGGHIQTMMMWMSPTSATVPTTFVGSFHEIGGISTGGIEQIVLPSGRMRMSINTPTTIYLSTQIKFTGTCACYGFISARRAR